MLESGPRRAERSTGNDSQLDGVSESVLLKGCKLPRLPALVACLAAVAALMSPNGALAKGGVTTTTCGKDRCRTVTDGIVGIAVLAGRVFAPRSGSFYVISLRGELDGGPAGWTILYEAKRQIVRGVDARAVSFLGTGWAKLTRDVRPHYAGAIRRLAPLPSEPGTGIQAHGPTPQQSGLVGGGERSDGPRNWIMLAPLALVALLCRRGGYEAWNRAHRVAVPRRSSRN